MFILIAIFLGSGCRPDTCKYEPPVQEESVVIVPGDLGLSGGQIPDMGAKELDATPTVGRFPTGISVVRVDAVAIPDSDVHQIQLASMPVERGAYWNQLVDDLPALREVIPHRTTGLDPRGFQYRAILRKSVEKDCGLCLIYARVRECDADAEYLGVLWDAVQAKPLASYRIPVTIADCRREDADEHEHPKPKRKVWLREADFRAEADLRQFVRHSIWDIARRDGFEPTTQPNPWQTDRPIYPRSSRWRLMEVPASGKEK